MATYRSSPPAKRYEAVNEQNLHRLGESPAWGRQKQLRMTPGRVATFLPHRLHDLVVIQDTARDRQQVDDAITRSLTWALTHRQGARPNRSSIDRRQEAVLERNG